VLVAAAVAAVGIAAWSTPELTPLALEDNPDYMGPDGDHIA
jgi:hypothetical protein